MNKEQLRTVLITENFNPGSYSLGDESKDEVLCLRLDENGWCVFYSERGLQTGKKYFPDESSACEHFLDEMRSDPTTKNDWKSGFHM